MLNDLSDYRIFTASPAVGILYEINGFISGHVRLRGKGNGAYPYKYLEMIDNIFGIEEHTIEVCSGNIKGKGKIPMLDNPFTVDIDQKTEPDLVGDGQILFPIRGESFNRWRCDPPYNEKTASEMYYTKMPSLSKLLKAGTRVVKPGSLMFLLCSQNYQHCPQNVKRIGCILMTIVPNNEIRCCNIYKKENPGGRMNTSI